MSTHNIGFYEEISKIITKLSSNIIKYAPYFFCWLNHNKTNKLFALKDEDLKFEELIFLLHSNFLKSGIATQKPGHPGPLKYFI